MVRPGQSCARAREQGGVARRATECVERAQGMSPDAGTTVHSSLSAWHQLVSDRLGGGQLLATARPSSSLRTRVKEAQVVVSLLGAAPSTCAGRPPYLSPACSKMLRAEVGERLRANVPNKRRRWPGSGVSVWHRRWPGLSLPPVALILCQYILPCDAPDDQ